MQGDELIGESGTYYDYIFASNGVFIDAESDYMIAIAPVASCNIRGLSPVVPFCELKFGKIPSSYFNLALSECLKSPCKEMYLAITYKDGYHLWLPEQKSDEGEVKYNTVDGTLLDIHSHGGMRAFFSGKDCEDEQGFKLSVVIGNLNKSPTVKCRVCVYGGFCTLPWSDIFEGSLVGASEEPDLPEAMELLIPFNEERLNELQSQLGKHQ